jgi:uncharacterized protein (TIGR00369 family)
MPGGDAPDPGFAERVERSFAKQGIMETLGATLLRVAPGEVEIALPVGPKVSQQHGFAHAGAVSTIADSAAGFAALTLMPPGSGVLTAEFKINLIAPAAGERLVASGRVLKAGRTLTIAQAEVHAEADGRRKLVAFLTATMVTVTGREGIVDD